MVELGTIATGVQIFCCDMHSRGGGAPIRTVRFAGTSRKASGWRFTVPYSVT